MLNEKQSMLAQLSTESMVCVCADRHRQTGRQTDSCQPARERERERELKKYSDWKVSVSSWQLQFLYNFMDAH